MRIGYGYLTPEADIGLEDRRMSFFVLCPEIRFCIGPFLNGLEQLANVDISSVYLNQFETATPVHLLGHNKKRHPSVLSTTSPLFCLKKNTHAPDFDVTVGN